MKKESRYNAWQRILIPQLALLCGFGITTLIPNGGVVLIGLLAVLFAFRMTQVFRSGKSAAVLAGLVLLSAAEAAALFAILMFAGFLITFPGLKH